jgi:hypothetical protein
MELTRQIRAFVDELPRDRLPQLKGFLEERLWREALARPAAALPVVPEGLWSTARAARFLDCSTDELRDRVHRGEIVAVRGRPNGRLHFEPAELDRYRQRHRTRSVANGLDHGYGAPHDTARDPDAAPATPLHPAAARQGNQRDRDDDRPLGARRAHRHVPGRNLPYAPGQAAWSGPTPAGPPPKG